MRWLMLVSLVACVGMCSVAFAEEKAATDQLPAALQAIGVDSGAVVSQEAAGQVRGQTGSDLLDFGQYKSFDIAGGTAVGTTNLLEGVFGTFKFTQIVPATGEFPDPSTLVIEGTFGGLSGQIGANSTGGLSFAFEGKAFQESFDFAGLFKQSFSQFYTPR